MATVWPLIRVAICLLAVFEAIGAQEGFISLQCGSNSTFIDPKTKIEWIPDDEFLLYKGSVHESYLIPTENQQLQYVRIFDTVSKTCYNFTTVKGQQYLIRGSFMHGDGYGNPVFNISIDATLIFQANTSTSYVQKEVILTATRSYLTYCLIPIKNHGIPFISRLEFRPLKNTIYTRDNSSIILKLLARIDLGNAGPSNLRYPTDSLDRIWDIDTLSNDANSISTNISSDSGDNMVPNQVMQTARTEFNGTRLEFTIEPQNGETKHYHVFLYFWEVDADVQVGQRMFNIYANGQMKYRHFDILGNGTSKKREFDFHVHSADGFNFSLEGTSTKFGPICNAYEVFQIITKSAGTVVHDVDALVQLRDELLASNPNLLILQRWTGDPCLPLSEDSLPMSWIASNCSPHIDTPGFIITGLDLSSKGLRGPIPSVISELANLEKLNLSYNHLEGHIPDLSALSRLVSLDIESNELKGTIPESIAQLQNLTTLLVGCNAQLNVTIPPDLLSKQLKHHSNYSNCQNQLDLAGQQ